MQRPIRPTTKKQLATWDRAANKAGQSFNVWACRTLDRIAAEELEPPPDPKPKSKKVEQQK